MKNPWSLKVFGSLHSAMPANITVKAAPAFGLRWTLHDEAPRSALYLQRYTA